MKVKLHDGQKEVALDDHRFRILCAGRRWGKSVLSQLITLKWAIENEGVYWIVSPTYRQGKQIHWRGLQSILSKTDWVLKKNEVELSITLKNGSIIELKGAENPDALRGVKLRGLVIDEIASIRNWDWLWTEVLRATLADYGSPALFISTPKGYNHFYDLFETGQKEGDYKSWRFTSYDNPYVPASEIDFIKKESGIDVFSQEYLAEFTRFTGLVYKEFNPDTHVELFDHTKNQHGDYYFGLDFAVRGWTALILGYIKPDGHIYIIDEYKVQGETVQVHAPAQQEVLTTYADFDKYEGYADPAGFAKNQQGMRKNQSMVWSLADEYFDYDFPIVRANNEVVAGINHVRQLFAEGKIHIHPRCVKLIEEIQQYQWKDQPITQIGTHEEPEEVRKINDHLVDALRYMLYSKPTAPEEQEIKRPTIFPAQWPKVNLYEESEDDKFEIVDFGTDLA